MKYYRRLQRSYHDGQLVSFRLGPRHEVQLEIQLDPVWNAGAEILQTVHISDIRNFDEVRTFFESLPQPQRRDASWGGVLVLDFDKRNLVIELDSGAFLEFVRPKVLEI